MAVLVGRQAPDFTAPAVTGNGEIVETLNFNQARGGKLAIIVFYPLDFTFVCPSELIALDRRVDQLKSLGVEVFAVSIDSHFTHNAWRNTPINQGGIGEVKYTMVADIDHSIVKAYGVEHPQVGVAFRGSFLIDQDGIVRHQVINDLPLGRNMDELVRMVEALQFHQEHGEVCPAGWNKGDKGMTASPEGVASYLKSNAEEL
ncbi:peroxiredoxin C [Thiotrichales bacterium 19S11-10]|nr:peroxiredoxin C [Thiotrichales bacterium 19S11-10]MCF6807141.1 peroxiredoxin C [Thiotrichales bacterium 19S9-11]MCF6811110.1 peroxiredoxin C [Thiotrichales bacterium 19S9-12]